ncbi:MAG: hypothetical protein JXA33_00960 [Anaerolineae bacterium]|nr:hypothetical protein [Anaerolineae bacterium]
MLKNRLVSALLVVCMLAGTGMVLAQGPAVDLPGSGWLTGQQVQNVGTGPADMVAEVYVAGAAGSPFSADATLVTGGLTDVPAGESRNILDNMWASAPESFRGAAVVSADQPIVAIVNIALSGQRAAAQYQGVGSPATSIGFPLWKYHFGTSDANYKETTFFVQNAGQAAAIINAQFIADDGTVYSWNSSAAVPVGEMVVISPADARSAANAAPPTRTKGGLTVTCTEPVAGVVVEHGFVDVSVLQSAKGFSASEYGSELVAPIIKQRFGANQTRSTGLQVQNVSAQPVTITVEYTEAGLSANPGTQYTQYAYGVAPGASFTFFENLMDGGDTIPDGVLAAAVVSAVHADGSPANIAAIVNESKSPASQPHVLAQTTYGAIAVSAGTTSIGVPLAKEVFGAAGRRNSTGIQVMNVGDAAATVEVAYAFAGTTYTIQGVSLAPGASETFFRVSTTLPSGASWAGGTVLPSGQFGGATVTSTNGEEIVAIVQETSLDAHQDNKNYEGFNLE